MTPKVQPLSYRHRFLFFYLLLGIFVASLPFLFLYANGYRVGWGEEDAFVSTGGIYVAAERSGVAIYIDDELVRETRIFRRAFYAQGLEAGTHKVHLQKIGHHDWTKELPVYAHLVTEAQAFNLPLVPNVRLVTQYQTQAGVSVLTATSTVLYSASTTSQYLLLPRADTTTLEKNEEFTERLSLFTPPKSVRNATTTATTTKEWRGVQLSEDKDGNVFASFVGSREQMPYYYCAEPFPRYVATTTSAKESTIHLAAVVGSDSSERAGGELALPLKVISEEQACDPVIQIDSGEPIEYFDFFPDSIDLLVIGTKSGAYVVEIDNRAWQNRQPLLLGNGIKVRVVNGSIYAYDGKVIYQILINQNWF